GGRLARPGDVHPAGRPAQRGLGDGGRELRTAPPRSRRAGRGVLSVPPGACSALVAHGRAGLMGRSDDRARRRPPVVPPPAHPSGEGPPPVPPELVPRHVAIVMDGNGRWANARGLPRTAGHEAGEAALLDVVAGAIEIGVKYVSAYAFSTENWKRSPEEVRFLMGFNRDVLRRRRDTMHDWGVRVRWAGRRPRLWRSV